MFTNYNHWQNCWNDGWFRGAPLPHFNVVRWKGKTWPTLEQNFAAAILKCQMNIERGEGGCWIFFFNSNEKQGIVRCAFQLLLSLIVGKVWVIGLWGEQKGLPPCYITVPRLHSLNHWPASSYGLMNKIIMNPWVQLRHSELAGKPQ